METVLYLLMADGSNLELGSAFSAALEDEELVCRDIFGDVVRRFARLDVTAYGLNAALKPQLVLGEARQVEQQLMAAPLSFASPGPGLPRPLGLRMHVD